MRKVAVLLVWGMVFVAPGRVRRLPPEPGVVVQRWPGQNQPDNP